MARDVLVPYDGSEQAAAALDFALSEYPDATVTLLHVIDPVEAGYSAEAAAFGRAEEWFENAKDEAEALFEAARERVGDESLESAVEVGRPSRAIVEYAEEHDVDHVVTGSHGRSGVSRMVLGSVAEGVVRRSPVPVTVVR